MSYMYRNRAKKNYKDYKDYEDYEDYEDQNGGCGGYEEQDGGCGGYREMHGGAQLTREVLMDKSQKWRDEVMAIFNQHKGEVVGTKKDKKTPKLYSLRDALVEASAKRKNDPEHPGYLSAKTRYVSGLVEKHKTADRPYQAYGKKNKRPLTQEAAERVLLQYYRDRANQFKGSPLTAMKKKITSCKAEKKMLTPCAVDPANLDKRKRPKMIVTDECKKSWMYRPGEHATGRTGPAIYSMRGVDGFCINDPKNKKNKTAEQKRIDAEAVAKSRLYNMKLMQKNPLPKKARKPRTLKTKKTQVAQAPELGGLVRGAESYRFEPTYQ